MTLTLTRVEQTALFVESGAVPAGEGFLAYWTASLPASDKPVTPKEAWDDPAYRGHFVFLHAAPADPNQLAAALPAVMPDPKRTSFAWISWNDGTGITGKQFLELDAASAVDADAPFFFERYGLTLRKGSPVEAVRDATGEPQRFAVSYPPHPGFPHANTKGVLIPLYDAGRFCLQQPQALLYDFGNDRETGFDVALYYGARYEGRTVSWRYPLFDIPRGGTYHILFRAQWDPLGALAPFRSALYFGGAAYNVLPSSIQPIAAGDIVPSFLRTIYGRPLSLRPRLARETSNPARLVFAQKAGRTSSEKALYLAPAGEFELAVDVVPGVDARQKLLCGLSGIESIDFRARLSPVARGNLLVFHPGKAAFAPVFPIVGSGQSHALALRADGNADLLTTELTTSWAAVHPITGDNDLPPYYQSQPKGSPLFRRRDDVPASKILQFYGDAQTVILDSAANAHPAPLVPYAGVTVDPGSPLADYEAQILTPVRLAAVTAPAASRPKTAALPADVVRGTTPQGFLVDRSGTTWQKVILARSTAGEELAFRNLGDDLRNALQNNELFLVATKKEPLGTFDNLVSIVGWPFLLNVGKRDERGSYTNVLVFKFGKQSLAERVADYASWTQPGVFNDDPLGVSGWLVDYIADARQQVRENPRFQPFLDIVDNPNWNGVLALRVDISTRQFPDDIKGLLAGIDLRRFFGHHFGITVSLVRPDAGFDIDRSSLFALINYVAKNDPAQPELPLARRRTLELVRAAEADGRYSFRVLNLQVVFANSEIVDFYSKITLVVTRWFGDLVTLPDTETDPLLRNAIVLYGAYENHNGVPYYTFQGLDTFRFIASSQVLNYVETVKAQFHAVKGDDAAADAGELVRSRFSLWGTINFKPLTGLDTFSFGDDAGDPNGPTEGLYFSNMGLIMSFVLEEDVQPVPSFEFDAAQMGFDISLSRARDASLFRKFPFRVSTITSGAGRTPSDAGYLPVNTPALKAGPLQQEWYGLYFALNLGSMGALAEKAGFSAGLVAAWSPTPDRPSAAVLIQIPGTSSGKTLLSLQSVLKLGIGKIELVEQAGAPGYFLLKLDDIGFFFLGKKFPSVASTYLTLFADDSGSSATNLGWYGAYFDPSA